MIKWILLAITLICFTQLNAQRISPAYFKEVLIKESCNGDHVLYNIQIEYHEEEVITLTYMGSNIESLTLYYYGKEIKEMMSFQLKTPKDFRNLHVEFIVNRSIKYPEILFSQKILNMERMNEVKISYGYFHISKFNSNIKISESCQDSVFLMFPFIATQTDISVSKIIGDEYKQIHSGYYYCCYDGNTLKIPRTEKGEFKVSLWGCHNSKASYTFELK